MSHSTPSTYDQALMILGAREHSTKELSTKLSQRGHTSEDIAKTIAHLQDMNYLNDQRFAEVFVRSRASKPLGPLRIRQELAMKGIKENIASQALEECEADWFELARELKERKFGEQKYADFKEKAKQTRYLQYRGFSFEHIKYALEPENF